MLSFQAIKLKCNKIVQARSKSNIPLLYDFEIELNYRGKTYY